MGLYSPSLRSPECRLAYYSPNVSLLGRSLLPSCCYLLLAGLRVGERRARHSPAYYSSDPAPQHWPLSLPILLVTRVWSRCAIPLVLGGESSGPMVARSATRLLFVRPRPHPHPIFSVTRSWSDCPTTNAGSWTCGFLPGLAQDEAPPTALKAPPTIPPGPALPAHSRDSPPPQCRKITLGGGKKAPIPPIPLSSALAPSAP